MKIYKVTLKVYHRWLTAYDGGYCEEVKYFTTYEKAINHINNFNNNPFQYGYMKKVEMLEPNGEHHYRATEENIEEIEVE